MTMVPSLVTSLPLILVIMTAGVDGLQDWGVNYSPSYVCALKGSTVKLSCTLIYPHNHVLKTVFWTKPVAYGDPPNLCSVPKNKGRVQCDREYKDNYRITLTSVTEAYKHIYNCRFTTNTEGGRWTGRPGVQLDVTNLQVETEQSVNKGDSVTLTCKSSCSLPQQTTFIWFRNTQRLTKESRKTLYLPSVTFSDSGNYQCAVSGEEHLKSPPVYLQVQWGGQQYWGVIYSPSYICALKGSTVTLSCSLTHTGYQLRKAFWTKTDGEPTNLCSDPEKTGSVQCVVDYKDTYSITWTSVTEADKHIYYCRFRDGQNKGWTVIPGAQLDVTDLQVETEQNVKETDSVTLTCKSSCSLPQKTTFIWFRNTQRLTRGIITKNQLHLRSVSLHDSGNYQCAVSGEEHLKSPPVYLNVEYPPKSVSVSISPSEIVEGDSVTLICSSDSNPRPEISWFKGEVIVGSGRNYNISKISSDHSGEYKCRSRNKYGETDSDNVMLNVKYAPRNVVVSLNSSAEIVEGDSVTLICSSDSNPPALNFRWFKGGMFVGSGRIYSISKIRSDHSGEYKCRSRNKYGVTDSDNVMLNLKYAPRNVVVSLNSSAEIVEGDSVTLICSSDSNPPALNFSWFTGGMFVGSGRIYSISKIRSDHSGEYKCRSRNKYGEKDSDNVMMNVKYAPRDVVVTLYSSAEIVEGDSVTLICSSDSNPPALNFSWFKENQSSAVGSGQSFIISSFNSSHSGRYYCEAQNQHGSQRSASVSVSVKGFQRAALHTVTGIVVGCVVLIFIIIIIIIIIIVFIRKKRGNSGAEDVRQNQDRLSRSEGTALTNDDPVYSEASANQTDDLYAMVQAKKPKRSRREQTEKDSGDAEEIQYASVHHFKNKDMNKTEETTEIQHPSDASRSEDVIYSSVK